MKVYSPLNHISLPEFNLPEFSLDAARQYLPKLDTARRVLSIASTLPLELYSIANAHYQEWYNLPEVEIPGSSHRVVELASPKAASLTPIFVIHGINSSAKQISPLAHSLRGLGIENPIYLINLGPDHPSIQEDAEKVAQVTRSILEKNKHLSRVHIIGHSRGGLVGAYFSEFLAKEAGISVEKHIAIASPMNGTTWASWGPTPAVQEELLRLPSGEPSPVLSKIQNAMKRHPFTCYYHVASENDLVVSPSGDSSIPAFIPLSRRLVRNCFRGHSSIKTDAYVLSQLCKWLNEDTTFNN